jgi:hypothetical protein
LPDFRGSFNARKQGLDLLYIHRPQDDDDEDEDDGCVDEEVP